MRVGFILLPVYFVCQCFMLMSLFPDGLNWRNCSLLEKDESVCVLRVDVYDDTIIFVLMNLML